MKFLDEQHLGLVDKQNRVNEDPEFVNQLNLVLC